MAVARPSGRSLIRTPDPVARRMLDVALDRIERQGMTVGLEAIGMEAVIAEAGVPRATAYRRWSSREAFLADVLVETVRRTSLIPETGRDLQRIVEVVEAQATGLRDPQGRRDLVVEALRVAADLDVRRILASPRWRTFVSLSATYQGLEAGSVRDQVGAALAETEAAFTTRRAEIYANLAGLLGYRLAPPLEGEEGYLVMAGASGATMTGIVLRALPRPAWLDERRRARLFGSSRDADWSEPERFLVGVLLAHLEPDPDVAWDEEAVARRFGAYEQLVRELMALPSERVDGDPARSPAQ